jgi:hypothetical protein
MKTPEAFSQDQLADLGRRVRRGEHPPCPACGATLDEQSVPPRTDVSYVRDRIWLVCPACHRNGVIDRRDVGRA